MIYFRPPLISRRSVLLTAIAGAIPGVLSAAEKTAMQPRTAPLPTGGGSKPDATAQPVPEFPTLEVAQAAAVSGTVEVGQTVRVLGYAEQGDGGGFVAQVIAVRDRGSHPHASRLKIIGPL
jgi:hypothetical protein